jgi:outer membrane protein
MLKWTTLAIAVSFFALGAPAYADEAVSVKLGYQVLAPSGVFSGKSTADTTIDMEKDLNFDDSNEVTAEVAFNFGNSRLSFGYMPIKTSGQSNTLSLTFNGQTFSGNITGQVDADLYDLGYTYYLVNLDDSPARLQLGLEVAVKVFDGEASVSGTVGAANKTESVSGTAPIPTLGARGRIALGDFFGITARAGYMSYSGNKFLDAEAQLEFSPIPLVGIYGGYRIIDIEVDEFDGLLDAEFSGPFAGAFVRF